jgi:hypothetical protein
MAQTGSTETKTGNTESAILVQLRIGRIGFRHFLSKAQVPGYELEQCGCGTSIETPRYILLHRPHEVVSRFTGRVHEHEVLIGGRI